MWFTVNLLFQSVHPHHAENEFLWEERVFLVRAESEEEARQAGEQIGSAEGLEYIAANGDLVRWEFRQVESVFSLTTDSLEPGTEVFSRFLNTAEVESILTPFED